MVENLLEEAKMKYPIRTKFISSFNERSIYIIKNKLQWWNRTDIVDGDCGPSVYSKGIWAEIIFKPNQIIEIW